VSRIISKINYKIHTDAIKDNLIPCLISAKQKSFLVLALHQLCFSLNLLFAIGELFSIHF